MQLPKSQLEWHDNTEVLSPPPAFNNWKMLIINRKNLINKWYSRLTQIFVVSFFFKSCTYIYLDQIAIVLNNIVSPDAR